MDVVAGIRWRVRTGVPWRDVLPVYAPWQTLCRWLRRWQGDGIWARVLTALQAVGDAAGSVGWAVSMDSTVSRVHHHAAVPAGMVIRSRCRRVGCGRSRENMGSSVHAVC
ncbi:transposase [Dactylosporangium vinaceum]|uniref:Transposase n=1 Tax=Dactylosporangium vinaceum TaxID=53362 RepID=A0ABV5M5T2_9ACTN